MSIILINGSPSKNGNSRYITDFIKSILDRECADYETVDVRNLDIGYCTGCGACDKTGWCIVKDEGVNLHKKFDKSNATIVVSPIYFNSVPAQLKTMIDRMQSIYASKYTLKKPTIDRGKKRYGAFIAVAGSTPYENQFLGAKLVMDMFFKVINTSWIETLCIDDTDSVPVNKRNAELEIIEGIVMHILKEMSK